MDQVDPATLRSETERWFIRAGLPHLIRDYSAREDILTRAAPALTLIFVAEVLLAGNLEWAWWQNVLAFVVGLSVIGAVAVVVNRLRSRRSFARPDSVGIPEVAAFLFVPPLLPVLFGDPVQGAWLLGGNVVALAVVYFFTSYGLLPTIRWAIVQLFRQFRTVGTLLARALPFLLLVTMFMFFNAELWKVVDDLPQGFLATAIGILVVAGSLFMLLFLRSEIDTVGKFGWWSEIHEQAERTPLAELDVSDLPDPPELEPLSRRARINVGVLLFFMQATQIVVVTLAVVVFYIAFGMFTILDTTIEQWTGSNVIEDLWNGHIFGSEIALTGELVRTALLVGAIAGLQFTVTALTDNTYRDEFSREVSTGLRRALAVRALYLVRLVPLGEGGMDSGAVATCGLSGDR